jgi:Tfp pilus assembly protein PilF
MKSNSQIFEPETPEQDLDLIHAIGVLATGYYNQGLLSLSTTKWKEILQIDPQNIHALEEIAGNYNEQGKTDLALKYCTKIEDLDQNNAVVNIIREDQD